MNDVICYNTVSVDNKAIILKYQNKSIRICFSNCAKNYATEKGIDTSKCVAVRDINKLSFTFYTQPKTRIIFKKRFLKDFISGKSAVSKFLDLQKAILQSGYTSYDLS